MKLRQPDDYVDREDMIDAIVDEIMYQLNHPDIGRLRTGTDRFMVDLLVQDGWVPLLERTDDEIQELYDQWIGGDLRINSFYGDDKDAQLELEMESRHG